MFRIFIFDLLAGIPIPKNLLGGWSTNATSSICFIVVRNFINLVTLEIEKFRLKPICNNMDFVKREVCGLDIFRNCNFKMCFPSGDAAAGRARAAPVPDEQGRGGEQE